LPLFAADSTGVAARAEVERQAMRPQVWDGLIQAIG
jgi:hypothetical protein